MLKIKLMNNSCTEFCVKLKFLISYLLRNIFKFSRTLAADGRHWKSIDSLFAYKRLQEALNSRLSTKIIRQASANSDGHLADFNDV